VNSKTSSSSSSGARLQSTTQKSNWLW
jgi:hypothetical protein